MTIRFIEMFAGLGGFRTGLANAGNFDCVGWCEIDKYAQRAYSALYETEGEYFCNDARKINIDELPEFELICAGPPCQSFSVAGRRFGFDDARGTLFFEVTRVAKERRPPYILIENVPGLLNHDKGQTFAVILSAFLELGYSIEWCILNSSDFGVPQQRRRVYIVCCLDERLSGKIFPLTESRGENLKQLVSGSQGSRIYQPNLFGLRTGVSTCLTSGAGGWGARTGLYFIDLNPDPLITSEARCITARQDSGISKRRGEHSGVLITDEEAPRAVMSPDRETIRQQGRRIKEPDEPMFTLTATDRFGILHHGRVRRLMPIECFRLQAYTDKQFQKLVDAGIPDSQLYKLAGNSVTTSVVTAIGKKLMSEIEKLRLEDEKNAQSC